MTGSRDVRTARFEAALEYGCVDLVLHPNMRAREYYASAGARTKRIVDMRGYPASLRREAMDAVELCWRSSASSAKCHRRTLGVLACVEAAAASGKETFSGMSPDDLPDGTLDDPGNAFAFKLLTRPVRRGWSKSEDVWYVEDLAVPPERLNHARPVKFIDFGPIPNGESRDAIKDYVLHLIRETKVALSSAYDGFLKVKDFAVFLGDRPVGEASLADVSLYEEACLSKTTVKYSYAKILAVKRFFDWMERSGAIETSPFWGFEPVSDHSRGLRVTAPDDYVIAQIGMILPSLPIEEALQYLILKCTGMRISELCLLKRDCLERVGDACFIRFWNQKMSKDVQNVIPPSLYRLIEEYMLLTPETCEYLFTAAGDPAAPARCNTVTSRLARSFSNAGIENPDGSPYSFGPHSMRHKMAVQLMEAGAPHAVIQEQLHHASPDMTVAYLEFDIRRRAGKARKFINSEGVETPCLVATERDIVESKVDWMRERLNAQILPNGVCSRPVSLGRCGKCNACLDCRDFRTSAEFLEVHRDHLAQTKAFIEVAKAAGWVNQLEGAERLKEKLERIIRRLGG